MLRNLTVCYPLLIYTEIKVIAYQLRGQVLVEQNLLLHGLTQVSQLNEKQKPIIPLQGQNVDRLSLEKLVVILN